MKSKHGKCPRPEMRRRFVSAVLGCLFLVSGVQRAAAGPSEIGAWVKGKWDPKAEPEVSLVFFRWGAKDTELTNVDRMIGQVASTGHSAVEIVMRTAPGAPVQYELRLSCGVQICGLGREPPCAECSFRRKYNGTTLVSRGAFVSNICCFDCSFPSAERLRSLEIVDVLAGGASIPYMVKFTTSPSLQRDGLKVPEPPKSRMHGASITVKRISDVEELHSGNEHGKGTAAAVSGEPKVESCGKGKCRAGPFAVSRDGRTEAAWAFFSFEGGTGPENLVVEVPGVKIKGMAALRMFAAGVKACAEYGRRISGYQPDMAARVSGTAVSSARFPACETKPVGAPWGPRSVQAVILVGQAEDRGNVEVQFRFVAVPPGSFEDRKQLFTSDLENLERMLPLLNPAKPVEILKNGD